MTHFLAYTSPFLTSILSSSLALYSFPNFSFYSPLILCIPLLSPLSSTLLNSLLTLLLSLQPISPLSILFYLIPSYRFCFFVNSYPITHPSCYYFPTPYFSITHFLAETSPLLITTLYSSLAPYLFPNISFFSPPTPMYPSPIVPLLNSPKLSSKTSTLTPTYITTSLYPILSYLIISSLLLRRFPSHNTPLPLLLSNPSLLYHSLSR